MNVTLQSDLRSSGDRCTQTHGINYADLSGQGGTVQTHLSAGISPEHGHVHLGYCRWSWSLRHRQVDGDAPSGPGVLERSLRESVLLIVDLSVLAGVGCSACHLWSVLEARHGLAYLQLATSNFFLLDADVSRYFDLDFQYCWARIDRIVDTVRGQLERLQWQLAHLVHPGTESHMFRTGTSGRFSKMHARQLDHQLLYLSSKIIEAKQVVQ